MGVWLLFPPGCSCRDQPGSLNHFLNSLWGHGEFGFEPGMTAAGIWQRGKFAPLREVLFLLLLSEEILSGSGSLVAVTQFLSLAIAQ